MRTQLQIYFQEAFFFQMNAFLRSIHFFCLFFKLLVILKQTILCLMYCIRPRDIVVLRIQVESQRAQDKRPIECFIFFLSAVPTSAFVGFWLY